MTDRDWYAMVDGAEALPPRRDAPVIADDSRLYQEPAAPRTFIGFDDSDSAGKGDVLSDRAIMAASIRTLSDLAATGPVISAEEMGRRFEQNERRIRETPLILED